MLDGSVVLHTLDCGDHSFDWLREHQKLGFRVFVRDESGNMRVENARLVWNRAPDKLSGFSCGDREIVGTLEQEILAAQGKSRTLDELQVNDVVFPMKRVKEAFYRDSFPDQEVYTLRFRSKEPLFFQLLGGHMAKSEAV